MKEENVPHYFYAISIPNNIQLTLKQRCIALEKKYSFKDWVHEQDYHITLTFLGAASTEVLAEMNRRLADELINLSSFKLYLEGVQAFGQKERPRILWCDIHQDRKLHHIQAIVQQICEEYGLSSENRAYIPHITVAKKWKGEHALTHLPSILNTPLSFDATEVVLYQVEPNDRPKYKRIATFSLKS